MPKIRFFPFDATYKIKGDKTIVYLFGRTLDGEQICIVDDSFSPYFYVIPKKGDLKEAKDKLMRVSVDVQNRNYSVVDVKDVKKKFLGEEQHVLKVIVNLPKAVPSIKDIVKEWDIVRSIHEFDILYVRRYMIDKGITPLTLVEVEGGRFAEKARIPVIKAEKITQISDETRQPKVLAVDIETYNPLGKNMVPEKHPIIMIGLYGKDFQKVITWKRFETKEKYIEFVNSEADLIDRFIEIVEDFAPDVITGYFSDGFDFPYIRTRANKYKLKLDIGLDYSELVIRGREESQCKITGIFHFDVFKFVRKIVGRGLKTDTYSLNDVAHELLGEKKLDVDMESLAQVWDKHKDKIEEYCRYNLIDAKLTYDLAIKLWPNLLEFVKIIGIIPYDINRMSFSQLVEWFIIKQASNFNEIAPNKPGYHDIQQRKSVRIKGAFVYEPKPGLYKDIVIFDYRSLYPTIIASHNISAGTLRCDCCEGKDVAPTEKKDLWFCTKKKGLIPTLIEDIITRRMRIKEIIKKEGADPLLTAREQSLKLLANSFYGYLRFFAARWYSFESAESVTAWGRYYITSVIDKAKKQGFHVLYSDTDSIFISLEGKTKDDAHKFVDVINKDLPGLMELEYEGFYPSGIFVSAKVSDTGAKKKYALLDENNDIKVKGFETVRRNWSFIAKDVQKEVLRIILAENNVEKALKYVKDIIHDLRKSRIPIEKVTIFTQLQKDISEYETVGPHVAAAQRMKNNGIDVGPGSLIKFVVTKGKGRIRDRVKLPEETKPEEYDDDYYINNQIIPAVDRIFMVLGYDPEQLLASKEQKGLGEFF